MLSAEKNFLKKLVFVRGNIPSRYLSLLVGFASGKEREKITLADTKLVPLLEIYNSAIDRHKSNQCMAQVEMVVYWASQGFDSCYLQTLSHNLLL